MNSKPGPPRVLHIHGAFSAEQPSVQRSTRLIDAFGGRLNHAVVSANGEWGAGGLLVRGTKVRRLNDFPALAGLPSPSRMQRLARALQDFDLVLTYGWGAIDAALAHTMFSKVHALPPLIHHEDGSDETAPQRRGVRSKWYRRVGLGKAAGLVVPTETMEHAALIDWQQPLGRVKLIRDGVDLKRFNRAPKPDAIPRLLKRHGELWFGCLAPNGGEGDIVALVQAMERLPPEWHLVILGPVPAEGPVAAAVSKLSLEHLVHVAPSTPDHAAALSLFDIVAVPRGLEPLPLAAIEAMAAAKPVLAFDRGETAQTLAADNTDVIAGATTAAALERLTRDSHLRQSLGEANREKAEAERGEAAMVAAYRRLYSSAIGRDAI